MNPSAIYLDSSALVKLVFEEPETDALEHFLRDWPIRACCIVGRLEVLRIARLVDDPAVERHARQLLNGVATIDATEAVLSQAAGLEPRTVRALDAIHLATALSLMPQLAGMVVYDDRLSKAARHHGITTWAPK